MRAKFIIISLLLSVVAEGQSTFHFGVFPTIDHSGTISNKLDYGLYYFGGFNLVNKELAGADEKANFFVFYSEQSLSYRVNDRLSLTGSYVYERQHPVGDNYRNENRFYLQGTYRYLLNRTTIKHRLRYDGRFINNRLTGETPYTSRLRYLFGITTPLQKSNDKVYFSAYNEFFFNTFKSASVIYGENWAFAGIGLKASKSSNLEFGPLYIYWVNKGTDLDNFLYLQLTWNSHIDFRKGTKK